MSEEEDFVSDSWRLDQEIMRRNASPRDPAALPVDELIRFLDEALRLAGGVPRPPRAAEHSRDLI